MTKCWGCQRPVEEHFRTCTHCGAAIATAKKPDAAAALEPPPSVVAERSAGRPTRARIQFVLNPQPAGTASGLPGGVQVESPPRQLSDHLRALRESMAQNAQATFALVLIVCCVIYGAAVGTPETYASSLFNAASPELAAQYRLHVRDLVGSFDEISWAGANIKIDQAWIAKVGQQEQMMLTREITPTELRRLYLKVTITGNAQAVGMYAGAPLLPLKTLTVMRQNQPVTLYYLDIAPFDTKPQVIVFRNPTNPKAGSLKLVLH